MICPHCQKDITREVASHLGQVGGVAAAAALTKKQRVAKARKAGRAGKCVPRPSQTRAAAMRAYWAARKA